MKENLSNHIKALLYLEDFTDGTPIRQEKCFTVQQFNYNCIRNRNSVGIPYGPTRLGTLEFTIRSLSQDDGKEFYHRLQDSIRYPFSFIFNGTFNPFKILKDYDDAIVTSGYILEVNEHFESKTLNELNSESMVMRVKILLHSITYIGKESNKILLINN